MQHCHPNKHGCLITQKQVWQKVVSQIYTEKVVNNLRLEGEGKQKSKKSVIGLFIGEEPQIYL